MSNPGIPPDRMGVGIPYSVVSLKDHIDAKCAECQRCVDIRFAEAQRAIDKAEKLMNDRLSGMNEFREQLKEQATHFIPRREYDIAHRELSVTVRALENRWSVAEGKASQSSVIYTAILAGLGLIVAVVDIMVRWVK